MKICKQCKLPILTNTPYDHKGCLCFIQRPIVCECGCDEFNIAFFCRRCKKPLEEKS